MSRQDRSDSPDENVRQILDALRGYEEAHPHAVIEARRSNPVVIRVRIIDPDFAGRDRVDREEEVWPFLIGLPEEVVADITMLLLVTPEEAGRSFASFAFDDPVLSRP